MRTEILKYVNTSAPDVHMFTYFEGGFEKDNNVTSFLTKQLPSVMHESVSLHQEVLRMRGRGGRGGGGREGIQYTSHECLIGMRHFV